MSALTTVDSIFIIRSMISPSSGVPVGWTVAKWPSGSLAKLLASDT